MNKLNQSKEPILVIMAAGIGSRYGGGIKQLASVGPNGEIIMDYSIYDARKAGFRKVVFIIRREIEKDFIEIIGNRISQVMDVAYAYQELDDLPEGFTVPADRKKPWGTGHAILCCKDQLDAPFAVINADDYYGPEAFRKIYGYLKEVSGSADSEPSDGGCLQTAMAGFVLGNTLSDNGTVTRGVCLVDEKGDLQGVEETKNIARGEDGVIRGTYRGEERTLSEQDLVSMNFWGFLPELLPELEARFVTFLDKRGKGGPEEYLLPVIVDELLQEGRAEVEVLPTQDTWFGITYAEDRAAVQEALRNLVEEGVYPSPLLLPQ